MPMGMILPDSHLFPRDYAATAVKLATRFKPLKRRGGTPEVETTAMNEESDVLGLGSNRCLLFLGMGDNGHCDCHWGNSSSGSMWCLRARDSSGVDETQASSSSSSNRGRPRSVSSSSDELVKLSKAFHSSSNAFLLGACKRLWLEFKLEAKSKNWALLDMVEYLVVDGVSLWVGALEDQCNFLRIKFMGRSRCQLLQRRIVFLQTRFLLTSAEQSSQPEPLGLYSR